MISLNGESHIEFACVEIDNNKMLPSIIISLSIQNEGFCGSITKVYIEWGIVKDFLAQTKDNAYKANYFSSLVSMSPDEMELVFEKINAESGLLKYRISKPIYLGRERQVVSLSGGGFEYNLYSLDTVREFFLQYEDKFV